MVGGSITLGQGAAFGVPNWPKYVHHWLEDEYGPHVVGVNGAVGGTRTSYMSVCHSLYVPKDSDIIFLEYSINDPASNAVPLDSTARRMTERLVRKLLQYPNKPAVVLVHVVTWWQAQAFDNWLSSAESAFNELALYYHLPSVSLRGCCWDLFTHNVTGFVPSPTQQSNPEALTKVSFFNDPAHPDGYTGHRVLGELAMNVIRKAARGLGTKPISRLDTAAAAAPIPQPLLPGNYESKADRCLIAETFVKVVTKAAGFAWQNETKDGRPRWGMVAKQVGSTMEVTVDTRATAHAEEVGTVLLLVSYLRSYAGMGQASVECVSGCACSSVQLDGHNSEHNSQLHLHKMEVTQSEACVVRFTVLSTTQSAGHKVKIAGVVISEEAGDKTSIADHDGALAQAHEGHGRPQHRRMAMRKQ